MPFDVEIVKDYLGKGIIYPIQLVNGKPKIHSGVELIKSSIKIIVSWPQGQRYLLGEFGSRLDEILNEQSTEKVKALLRTFFQDAVTAWEPRVEEIDVVVENDPDNPAKIVAKVNYRILNSPTEQSFIWPFYLNQKAA